MRTRVGRPSARGALAVNVWERFDYVHMSPAEKARSVASHKHRLERYVVSGIGGYLRISCEVPVRAQCPISHLAEPAPKKYFLESMHNIYDSRAVASLRARDHARP
jgi:hypothetical protein